MELFVLGRWLTPDTAPAFMFLIVAILAFGVVIAAAVVQLRSPVPPHAVLQVGYVLALALTSALVAAAIANLLTGAISFNEITVGPIKASGQGPLAVFIVALLAILTSVSPFIVSLYRHRRSFAHSVPVVVPTRGWPTRTLEDDPPLQEC